MDNVDGPKMKRMRQRSIVDCLHVKRPCSFQGTEENISGTERGLNHQMSSTSEIAACEDIGSLENEFSELRRIPDCAPILPELKSGQDHTVLCKLNASGGWQPSADSYTDKWDECHVRMPCSPQSLYPMEEQHGQKHLESRWDIIRSRLNGDSIKSSKDLEEAILSYNVRYSHKWNFKGLHQFFAEVLSPKETEEFFSSTLPRMIRLALQLPYLCTQPIPLLKQQMNHTITFSQMQIASLLANAFFCTFPRRNSLGKYTEYSNYPEINFTGLYSSGDKRGVANRKAEKLKCLLHYFKRVTSEEPSGVVSFTRQHLDLFPDWNECTEKLCSLHATSFGCIEDRGIGMLQVDFANKMVGGGVLGWGCVQEEIRFIICPELIISRLITERLSNSEALIITGCEQFSKYDGYADNFKFVGDYVDPTQRDAWGRKYTKVVAMDAKSFSRSKNLQYKTEWLIRELNKAYCGFHSPGVPSKHLEAVATGNWGCGVYNGDPRLKVLLQIIAATKAGRELVYFTFKDEELKNDINDIYNFLISNEVTIGSLWKMLNGYKRYTPESHGELISLYDHIRSAHTTEMPDVI